VPDDRSTELELYKLAVEMADRTSARRAGANSFFVTLNAALAGLIGILGSAREAPPHASTPTFDAFGLSIAAVAGTVLALTWWALLRYYRRLNRAKFKVINEMETKLPDRPYTREWEILHPDEAAEPPDRRPGLHAWYRRERHREASIVEQVVPFVFAAIYLVMLIRIIWFR
jgi:hypothetical protein